jgi:L-threonylcarbamoyladenylate synthase
MLPVFDEALSLLQAGEVIGLPTETVYGLAGNASNEASVQKIFRVKDRPADHPLIVHIASAANLRDWAQNIPPVAYQLAEAFWPGPLTLVLDAAPHVLSSVTGGQSTIALRIPAHPIAQQLLSAFGGGLAAPSANPYGCISPTTAAQVRDYFDVQAVPLVLDGGPCVVGIESTIVRVEADGSTYLLRPGDISPHQINTVLKQNIHLKARGNIRVSGMHHRHYAPRKRALWCSAAEFAQLLKRVDLRASTLFLSCQTIMPDQQSQFNLGPDAKHYAQSLYSFLARADQTQNISCILLEMPPETPEWLAVRDRISRAAMPWEGDPLLIQ